MTTTIAQVRLPQGIMKEINKLVSKGLYTNKSDLIREAIRRFIFDKQVGPVSNV